MAPVATTTSLTPHNYGGGWAVVVGGAALVALGGTRFGKLAAGLTSVALIFQLVSLVGASSGAKVTSATTGAPAAQPAGSGSLSTIVGPNQTPAPAATSQIFS